MQERKYSVIVFDLGNVLLPFNNKLIIERFNKVSQGLGDKFLNYYKENYFIHRNFERGDISEDEFINLMLNVLEKKVDKNEFINAYSKIFTVNEDVVSLIPELEKKYMLILLSNTDSIHRKYGWKNFPFLKYFDKFILSYEVHAVKPEGKIYRAAELYSKKPSNEHFFIDDILEYAEGAKKTGWDAVQFTGYDNLVKDLKDRKIL